MSESSAAVSVARVVLRDQQRVTDSQADWVLAVVAAAVKVQASAPVDLAVTAAVAVAAVLADLAV